MKYFQFIILPVIILLIVGCGEPKIDTSTDKSMRSSIEKVRESLPADKRLHFNEAMLTVAIGNSKDEGIDIREKMKTKLNGKTGLQIILEAEKINSRKN